MITLTRNTKETSISITLFTKNDTKIETGIPFFDTLLSLCFDNCAIKASVICRGDLHVDAHHTVEDVGIALGQAFAKIKPLKNHADATNFYTLIAIELDDFSKVDFNCSFENYSILSFDLELIEEFFIGFSRGLNANLCIKSDNNFTSIKKVRAVFAVFGQVLSYIFTGDG